MKYFLLLITTSVLFTLPALAQDIEGTWTWVGAGCRDSSLSSDSHVTKPKSQNPFQIAASRLYLNSDGSAEMSLDMQGERRRETGFYEVDGDRVVITDPDSSGTTEPVMNFDIVDGYLILSTGDIEEDDLEREEYDPVAQACRGESSDTYVYVFANIGR